MGVKPFIGTVFILAHASIMLHLQFVTGDIGEEIKVPPGNNPLKAFCLRTFVDPPGIKLWIFDYY